MVQVIGTVLQLGLVGAAIWLAVETRFLREKTGLQADLLREQLNASDRPSVLVVGLRGPGRADGPLSLSVINLGRGIAYNIDYWWYDSQNRNLCTTKTAASYLQPDTQTQLEPSLAERFSPEQAIASIRETFSLEKSSDLDDAFRHSDYDYTVIVYANARSGVFIGKRELPKRDAAGDYGMMEFQQNAVLR
ncbi:MAG TPA: hypothetical protein VHT05_02890 [Candidatus Elarobacter sp.]|nr:hypothetical protein [Candidatus Elarobacter sp.]